jgi:hypothetical protein
MSSALYTSPREVRQFPAYSPRLPTQSYHKLPPWIWIAFGGLLLVGCFSPNPLLTPFATALLLLFPAMLWRRSEPPVLVFASVMQWLQAASVVYYADAYGLSLTELFSGPELEHATWLSLVAVAVNAVGMRLMLLHTRSRSDEPRNLAAKVIPRNAFLFYLASFFVATLTERYAFEMPSLTQAIFATGAIKWVALFVLFYSVVQQRRGYGFLVTAVIIEFAIGLLGYFASFKSVFFILLVTWLTSARLTRKNLIQTATIVVILFTTGIVWSAVKQDYRDFLNQGTGEQQVLVPIEERGAKLSELVGGMSWDSFANGLDTMMLRVSQVSLFASTLMNVPERVPYEHGALWADAVKRVIMPRILFPNKPVVDDSERTNYYTGLAVAGAEKGTSIAIGYIAESYVDFGPFLMFFPILLLGMFYGLIYRVFTFSRNPLLGYGIATAILSLGAYTIETSNIKLVGMNLSTVLCLGALYLVFGRVFMRWLIRED